MRKLIAAFVLTISLASPIYSQYANEGTGALKNQIWWFDWNGFTIANGASRVFNTADGLQVTITFSNVSGPGCVPDVMETWYGSVLHFLYDFSNANIKPTIHTLYSDVNSLFTINVTATRNGVPAAFKFVAADAEASAINETISLQTSGTPWTTIDFFRNSSQTSNPLTGCNTTTAIISDTYGGGSTGNGQNPVIGTDALTGSLTLNTTFTRNGVEGRSAVAFGIFASIDRGDHVASYGTAHHNLIYSSINACNYMPPFPSLGQSQSLKLGSVAGDPDGGETSDDNSAGVDEDGVNNFPDYINNGTYSLNIDLQNTTGADAFLAGWFDYNRNGNFEPGERTSVVVPNNATNATLTWTGLPATFPQGGFPGYAFRFRLSSNQQSVQSAIGFSPDGEVEDYLKNITPNFAQANFLLPDTICQGSPVDIQNITQDGTTYYWNFCSGSLDATPTGTNFTSPSFSLPVFMDLVQDGPTFYAFVVNHSGSLARMNFGNSFLNAPVTVDLGDLGAIPPQAEGIEIRKDGNTWIGYLIGGQNANSRLVKLNFGTSLANVPVATNLGNIGSISFPVDLSILQENGNWYGFTVNADNNTITRYSFGSSLNNAPVATNLGNIGSLSYPDGFFVLKDGPEYFMFITNRNSNSISRISFSNSLANTPTGINMGNPGGNFSQPRDITVIVDCDRTFGFVTNEGTNTITRLDFEDGLTSPPVTSDIGNIGNLSFPHSISEVFRTGDAVNFMITNVTSNSVSRLSFTNCAASSIPSYTGVTPPTFTYNQPGTYNISLFVDDGLPTQNVLCKNIVVLPAPEADFQYDVDVCDPFTVTFTASSNSTINPVFNFGDNTSASDFNAVHTYAQPGTYDVEFLVGNGDCRVIVRKTIDLRIINENIVRTNDTTICLNATKQLLTEPVLDFCWYPTDFLDDPTKPNPITSTIQNITYYFIAKTTGTNLIINGDFSQGNTGFTSDYDYSPGSGVNPGKYNVGTSITSWHPGMAPCGDHTTGNANMLMVNGASGAEEIVWSQTINIQPNTNYAFSAWLQHITSVNPAELQFSINGQLLGQTFVANDESCIWERFYETWHSGTSTTAVISIVNQNTVAWGNDFALDDLVFSPLQFRRDSVIITVEDPVIKTINDTTICVNNPVTLTTTGASSYTWSPPLFLSDPSIANPVATPNTTIDYTVTGTTVNGCIAQDAVIVTVNPELVYTLTEDTTICFNTSLQLLATGGTNITWIPHSTLSDETIANPTVNPDALTTYYVTITDDNDCVVNDSVKVDVRPLPVFAISENGIICENDSLQLSASGGDVYAWLPNNDITNAEISDPVVFPTTTTEYSVLITDTVCNNTANLSTIVTVNSLPLVIAEKSNDIDCTNGFAILSGSGARSYVWSPVEHLDNYLISTPKATPELTTEYVVTGTDENGCVNNATVIVEVSQANKVPLYMPNAFTPNNDGLNDCYGVKYPGLTDNFELSIYNRWGERIFHTKNSSDCWDGKYKGVPQEIGVYVFILKSDGLCGSKFEKGLFTLIR